MAMTGLYAQCSARRAVATAVVGGTAVAFLQGCKIRQDYAAAAAAGSPVAVPGTAMAAGGTAHFREPLLDGLLGTVQRKLPGVRTRLHSAPCPPRVTAIPARADSTRRMRNRGSLASGAAGAARVGAQSAGGRQDGRGAGASDPGGPGPVAAAAGARSALVAHLPPQPSQSQPPQWHER